MLKLLNEPLWRALFWAKVHAAKNGRQLAAREDVLYGLAHEWPDLQAKLNLPDLEATPQEKEEMRKALEFWIGTGQWADGMDNPFDQTCAEAFRRAIRDLQGGSSRMTLRHFLVALGQEDQWVMQMLEDKRINPSELPLESE